MYALVVCTKTDNFPSDLNIKYWVNIAKRGQVLLVILLITIHFIIRGREKDKKREEKGKEEIEEKQKEEKE